MLKHVGVSLNKLTKQVMEYSSYVNKAGSYTELIY